MALEYASDVTDYSLNTNVPPKQLFLMNWLLEKYVEEYENTKKPEIMQ